MATFTDYAIALRRIRRAQGLTLKQVEIKSRGEFKAVVVGSYERGSRSLSLQRAIRLCQIYGVPLHALSGETDSRDETEFPQIDLESLRAFPAENDLFALTLRKIADQVLLKRGDWNGQILTIRNEDWRNIMLILGSETNTVREALNNRGLTF